MRNRGIEAWRARCDCIECYQIWAFVSTPDTSKITKEELDRVLSIELPEGHEIKDSIKTKLNAIKTQVEEKENKTKKEEKVEPLKTLGNIGKNSNKFNNKFDKRQDKGYLFKGNK